MELKKEHAPAESQYEGLTYYFCSLNCMSKFEKCPAAYSENTRKARSSAGN